MQVNTFHLKVIVNSEIVAYFSSYHTIPFFYNRMVLDELHCSFPLMSLPSKGQSGQLYFQFLTLLFRYLLFLKI